MSPGHRTTGVLRIHRPRSVRICLLYCGVPTEGQLCVYRDCSYCVYRFGTYGSFVGLWQVPVWIYAWTLYLIVYWMAVNVKMLAFGHPNPKQLVILLVLPLSFFRQLLSKFAENRRYARKWAQFENAYQKSGVSTPPKNRGPKTIFCDNGNFNGLYLRKETWYT